MYNVPEGAEGLSMLDFVEKLLWDTLELAPATELPIERAHPAGTRETSVLEWEIYFDQDYTPAVLQKRKEYSEAKRVLKQNKIHFQTPYPTKLQVFYDDETRL